MVLGWICWLFPNVRNALAVVRPETVMRWHRGVCDHTGAGSSWLGRPVLPAEIRKLIREMSIANPLWGAPRIHGELLKLGIDIGQTSEAKYMLRRRGPPSQGWKIFLRNQADGIVAMDRVRSADCLVPVIVWALDHGAWPATDPVAWRDGASDW